MKKLLMILLAAVLVFSITGCGEEAEVEPAEEDKKEAVKEERIKEEAKEEKEEDKAEEDEREIGTRDNPAGINEGVELKFSDWLEGEVELEIELTEVIRGEEAWNIIREANQFNEEPEEGREYLMAKFYVMFKDLEEEPFDMNHARFDLVSEGGVTYEDFVSVSDVEPDLRVDLYEGSEHEGYTYFFVDEDDDNPLIAFERDRDHEIWFDPN